MPGMMPFSHARVETNLSFTLLDPRPSENPIKSLLSFRPSLCLAVLQFGILLRNGSLVFSDFFDDGR